MTTAADLYTFARTGAGANDFRLVPRRPIQTRDVRTRDDVLTGPEPEKRIGLGLVYDGSLAPPHHEEFTSAVKELGEGTFAAGRVLHASELDRHISLGRTWIGEMEALRDKAADAELRARDNARPDAPPEPGEKTKDSTASLFGKVVSPASYAEGLRKGRETQDQTPPAPKARVTGAEFAALRAAKGAR